jgi:hypothetical protein
VPDTLAIRAAACPVDPPPSRHHQPGAGLTVEDAARRYRVSPDKIRVWIALGELRAVNTSAVKCAKPRWVIPPEALDEFERKRSGGPGPKPMKRRCRPSPQIDFFPD